MTTSHYQQQLKAQLTTAEDELGKLRQRVVDLAGERAEAAQLSHEYRNRAERAEARIAAAEAVLHRYQGCASNTAAALRLELREALADRSCFGVANGKRWRVLTQPGPIWQIAAHPDTAAWLRAELAKPDPNPALQQYGITQRGYVAPGQPNHLPVPIVADDTLTVGDIWLRNWRTDKPETRPR